MKSAMFALLSLLMLSCAGIVKSVPGVTKEKMQGRRGFYGMTPQEFVKQIGGEPMISGLSTDSVGKDVFVMMYPAYPTIGGLFNVSKGKQCTYVYFYKAKGYRWSADDLSERVGDYFCTFRSSSFKSPRFTDMKPSDLEI